MDALLQQSIPGIAFAVCQSRILISCPFLIEGHATVLIVEVSRERLFKAAAEDHGGTGVLLLPAVEIPIAVQAWAAQILANLCVAVDHRKFLLIDSKHAGDDRPKSPPTLRKRQSCPSSDKSGARRFCAQIG